MNRTSARPDAGGRSSAGRGIQVPVRPKPVAIAPPAKAPIKTPPVKASPVTGFPLRSMRVAAKQIKRELAGIEETNSDYTSALRVMRTQALRIAAVADELLAKQEKAGAQ